MKAIKVMSKDGKRHTHRFQMTEADFRALDNDSEGLCLGCGEAQSGCEPDAEKYTCEGCGEPRVYGIDLLLTMGRIEIEEDAHETA